MGEGTKRARAEIQARKFARAFLYQRRMTMRLVVLCVVALGGWGVTILLWRGIWRLP